MIIHTVPFATWKTKATKDDKKDFITAWQISTVFLPLTDAAFNQKPLFLTLSPHYYITRLDMLRRGKGR